MKFKIIQTLIFLMISIVMWGQTLTDISSPVLDYNNECLYISYNINGKSSEIYNVWIEVLNSKGEKINAQALSGNIGPNIKSGNNKTIVWNLTEDNIFLDEAISVKIFAQFTFSQYSKGKLLVLSTVWPGWGQSKLKKGKPYWLIGVAGVGCIAGSYWYNQQSVNSYNQYIDAITISDSDKYYNQAIQQDNTSKILAYSAIGIWTINIIWVALMPNKINSNITHRNVKLSINPVYAENNFTSVSLCLSLNIKP